VLNLFSDLNIYLIFIYKVPSTL